MLLPLNTPSEYLVTSLGNRSGTASQIIPPSPPPVLETGQGLPSEIHYSWEPLSYLQVDTKLRLFHLLIVKYLQYIPQPAAWDHTTADKQVRLTRLHLPHELSTPATQPPASPFLIPFPFPSELSLFLSEWFSPPTISPPETFWHLLSVLGNSLLA